MYVATFWLRSPGLKLKISGFMLQTHRSMAGHIKQNMMDLIETPIHSSHPSFVFPSFLPAFLPFLYGFVCLLPVLVCCMYHSLTHYLTQSVNQTAFIFVGSLVCSFVRLIIHSFIHSFIRLIIHSFIHAFTHSCIHAFMHSC